MNPRFYVKLRTDENTTVYLRASHSYLRTFDSPEEAADFIDTLQAMKEEDFWRKMLFDHFMRMPTRDAVKGYASRSGLSTDMWWQEAEDEYKRMWYKGTEQFYAWFPECLVTEEIPFDTIHQVRRAEIQRRDREQEEEQRNYKKRLRTVTWRYGKLYIQKLI